MAELSMALDTVAEEVEAPPVAELPNEYVRHVIAMRRDQLAPELYADHLSVMHQCRRVPPFSQPSSADVAPRGEGVVARDSSSPIEAPTAEAKSHGDSGEEKRDLWIRTYCPHPFGQSWVTHRLWVGRTHREQHREGARQCGADAESCSMPHLRSTEYAGHGCGF